MAANFVVTHTAGLSQCVTDDGAASGFLPLDVWRGSNQGLDALRHFWPLWSAQGQKRRIDALDEFAACPLSLR